MDITFRLKTFLLKTYRPILKKISLFLSILLTSHVAHAEMSSIIKNTDSELPKSNSEEVQPNITNSIHQNSPETLEEGAMSGNPAFTELFPGTGALGRYLKFPDDWGVKLGGVTLSDTGKLFTGGQKPGSVASNNAFILATSIDTEKAFGWRGGKFGASFLQVNGQNTNGYAGTVVGYDAIVGAPPFHRTELYTLYFEQEIIKERLGVRAGKLLGTVDFNNVTKVHRYKDDAHYISSLSSLLYTSIFVNPTMLPAMSGYYDPAYGVVMYTAPTENTWANAGVYDGNKATGLPSGIHNLKVNDYVFSIGEAGISWLAGEDKQPGQFGIGVWHQSGQINAQGIYGNIKQTGAEGIYFYGGQRVWTSSKDKIHFTDHSEQAGTTDFKTNKVASITMFYQYGVNNSKTMNVRQFVGAGFTAFSFIDERPDDSAGAGMSLSFLNQNRYQRASELMFQTYYQAAIVPGAIFLQPTLSYIPTPGQIPDNLNYTPRPGQAPNLSPAVVGTLRLTGVF